MMLRSKLQSQRWEEKTAARGYFKDMKAIYSTRGVPNTARERDLNLGANSQCVAEGSGKLRVRLGKETNLFLPQY